MKKFYCYQKLSAPHLFYLQDPETEKEYLAHTKSDIYRDEEELISFIESTMATHLIPGLSISVVKDENIVWERYFGYFLFKACHIPEKIYYWWKKNLSI